MSEKIYVDCPFAEESSEYTTNECKDCFMFWDCKTGLKCCLEDEGFEEHFEEIRNALNGD